MTLDLRQIRELLATLRFTGSMSPRSLDLLSELGAVRSFPAAATIFREGSPSRSTYLLESGHVALDVLVPGRGVVRLLTLGAGDLLAWSGLVDAPRMTATAVTLEPTIAVEFPTRELRELADRDHEFGYAWMRATADALAKRLAATRLQWLDVYAGADDAGSARGRNPS